jgi:hypothetical protein
MIYWMKSKSKYRMNSISDISNIWNYVGYSAGKIILTRRLVGKYPRMDMMNMY